jgi:hypothetical protein
LQRPEAETLLDLFRLCRPHVLSRNPIEFSMFRYQPPPASKSALNKWDWRLGGGWCAGDDRKPQISFVKVSAVYIQENQFFNVAGFSKLIEM